MLINKNNWLKINNKVYHLLSPNVKLISDVRKASMLKIIIEYHVTKQMIAQILSVDIPEAKYVQQNLN